ncbi:hypothetical protein [Dyella silvatica]|uniref:hypothetical protein n=1 Tax=Dyella silvatica TaxID=2992128 RepID=UPI002250AE00|nr:hypothetical protein [Dyella silvatica]
MIINAMPPKNRPNAAPTILNKPPIKANVSLNTSPITEPTSHNIVNSITSTPIAIMSLSSLLHAHGGCLRCMKS